MSEEELYNDIVEQLSSGNFLQLNGKAINLSELNDYINAQQQEIERLNNIINELEKELDKGFEVYICNGRKAGKSIELGYKICQKKLLNKLQELKGSDKE